MKLTQKLSEFVADLSFNDLSAEAVKMAKFSIMDTIGVIFAGSTQASSRIMVKVVRDLGGHSESTVIGRGFKTSSINAALANGATGHALDYDDTTTCWMPSTRGGLHAGSPIVSAALAASEVANATGKEFLTAVAAGYDIGARIAFTCQPNSQAGAWHPSGVFGTFGATASAGNSFRFNTDQMKNAFGISGSMASGILQCLFNGSPMKRVHSGLAARNGVLASLMAQNSLPGPDEIFEGKYGFFNAYYKGIHNPELITAKLGEDFAVAHNSFKLYPACSITHAAIDAALDLAQTYDIKPDQIQEINVAVSQSAYSYCCEPLERKYNPQTMVDIEFNIPFAIAVALSKRQVTMKEYSEAGMKDPEVLNLGRKVKPFIDPELWHPKTRLEIVLKTGKKLNRTIDVPKGWPKSSLPWSFDELFTKFRTCASVIISEPKKIEEIIEMINHLEKVDNINQLGNLIR